MNKQGSNCTYITILNAESRQADKTSERQKRQTGDKHAKSTIIKPNAINSQRCPKIK